MTAETGVITPKPRLPLLLTAFAITAANFMNVLDLTIAVVAVPSISGTLGASPSQGTWVLTTYSVCLAIVLPLSPWVCKRYGEVRTFTASVLMFALTSWICGLSTNIEMLVFFRALQGLSSGLIVPLSQTVLLRIFPPINMALRSVYGVSPPPSRRCSVPFSVALSLTALVGRGFLHQYSHRDNRRLDRLDQHAAHGNRDPENTR